MILAAIMRLLDDRNGFFRAINQHRHRRSIGQAREVKY